MPNPEGQREMRYFGTRYMQQLTPEDGAKQLAKLIKLMDTLPRKSPPECIAAYLDVTPPEHWESTLDKLARFKAFCDRVERAIVERSASEAKP